MATLSSSEIRNYSQIVLGEIVECIVNGTILDALTLKNGKLRKSMKSDAHPLARYVHRMIEFYSGDNPCMPVNTQLYMQDFVNTIIDKKNGFRVYLLRDGVEDLYHALDNYAENLCIKFDKNPLRVAKIWEQSIGSF